MLTHLTDDQVTEIMYHWLDELDWQLWTSGLSQDLALAKLKAIMYIEEYDARESLRRGTIRSIQQVTH